MDLEIIKKKFFKHHFPSKYYPFNNWIFNKTKFFTVSACLPPNQASVLENKTFRSFVFCQWTSCQPKCFSFSPSVGYNIYFQKTIFIFTFLLNRWKELHMV